METNQSEVMESKENPGQGDRTVPARQVYVTPKVIEIGRVAAVTFGASGPLIDVDAPGSLI